MRRVGAEFKQLLLIEQKEDGLNISRHFATMWRRQQHYEIFMDDETWAYRHDVQPKQQTSQRKLKIHSQNRRQKRIEFENVLKN
jgi:hypothetical protein